MVCCQKTFYSFISMIEEAKALIKVKHLISAGKYVVLILGENAMIYEYKYVLYHKQTVSISELFEIDIPSGTRIKAAFNSYKVPCGKLKNKNICAKTTILASNDKHYEVVWTNKVR